MRVPPAHIAKRQGTATAIPTADGLGAAQTASAGNANADTGLLLSSGGASSPQATITVTAGLIAGGASVIITTNSPATGVSTPTTTTVGSASSSHSSSSLSTGAVIGIIVAAFAGFILVVLVVYGILRRRRSNATSARSPSSRNVPGEISPRQPWKKLDDDQDRWEGREKSSSSGDADANQLSLFRKASSVRTIALEKSSTTQQFDLSTMPGFAKYHPDLAAELATSSPPVRPFANHPQNTSITSWDRETLGNDSFLSLRLSDSSAVSPSSVLKQTPVAVASTLHKWQSAEVVTMDSVDSSDVTASNPFADEVSTPGRRGGENPFFSAHPSSSDPFKDPQSRSHKDAPQTIRRSSSADSIETVRAGPVRPDSTTRPESSSQAMQNLLAVLNADEGESHPKHASLQPSVVSSQYPETERISMTSFVTYTPKAM